MGDAVTARDALVENAAKVRDALVGEVVRDTVVGEKKAVKVRDEVVGVVETVRGALVMEAVSSNSNFRCLVYTKQLIP